MSAYKTLTDERLMALLESCSGVTPVRLPPGWKNFARAVEDEVRAMLAAAPQPEQPEQQPVGELTVWRADDPTFNGHAQFAIKATPAQRELLLQMNGTKLYAAPAPAADVRELVEALRDAREVLDAGGARAVYGCVDKACALIRKLDAALAKHGGAA